MQKYAFVGKAAVDAKTNRLFIRGGQKGKGKEIWSCQYWDNSYRSVEQAYEWLDHEVERLRSLGYEIVYAWA